MAEKVAAQVRSGERDVGEVLGPLTAEGKRALNTAPLGRPKGEHKHFESAPAVDMPPIDEYNVKHVSHVHPPDYVNSTPPEEPYDLVVIGGGVGGLLSVIMGNALGKKCVLVEKHYMGGDCLNVGCFPSKSLIACAKRAHQITTADDLGIHVDPANVRVDFSAIMKRLRKLRSDIAPIDSVERYKRDFCHDIFLGHAIFTSPSTIEVEGKSLSFHKAMIATGTSPLVPDIPNLASTPHLTNGNFFDLEDLPPSLVVIGGGPIGVELAQAMQRLGSRVYLIALTEQLLAKEDPEASRLLASCLQEEGITLLLGTRVTHVSITPSPEEGAETNLTKAPFHTYRVVYENANKKETLTCNAVLNATGRVPNVEGLGLDSANVQYDTLQGVLVNEFYQTSNPNVYACGDVASAFKFTHSADWGARIAIRNMFLGPLQKSSRLVIPWCTYSDPEVAHVGKYERDLEREGVEFDVLRRDLAHVDRCKCDGDTIGFVKMLVRKGSDEILGATIVASAAGDMLSEITLAMQYNVGATKIAGVMHPYPTKQEAVRQCAAQANKVFKSEDAKAVVALLMKEPATATKE